MCNWLLKMCFHFFFAKLICYWTKQILTNVCGRNFNCVTIPDMIFYILKWFWVIERNIKISNFHKGKYIWRFSFTNLQISNQSKFNQIWLNFYFHLKEKSFFSYENAVWLYNWLLCNQLIRKCIVEKLMAYVQFIIKFNTKNSI